MSANRVTLTNSQRTSILNHGQPTTVQQMLAFLGLTGYSHNHIPRYVDLTQPLRDIVAAAGNRNLTAPLKWSVAAEEAFTATKQALAHAASLASPDYDKDFHLDVSETGAVVNAVLFQKKEGTRNVLMYHSSRLDSIERGQTVCARYMAALTKAITKTSHIIMCHPLKVNSDHGIPAPHITFESKPINMAHRMTSDTHAPHDCEALLDGEIKLREDLQSKPLEQPDLTLFTDGCCYKGENGNVERRCGTFT